MKKICSICERTVEMVGAATLPSGVVRGIYYESSGLVWTPDPSAIDARDGIDWQLLHTRCVQFVNQRVALVMRPWRGA
jgi:hypothetical protein